MGALGAAICSMDFLALVRRLTSPSTTRGLCNKHEFSKPSHVGRKYSGHNAWLYDASATEQFSPGPIPKEDSPKTRNKAGGATPSGLPRRLGDCIAHRSPCLFLRMIGQAASLTQLEGAGNSSLYQTRFFLSLRLRGLPRQVKGAGLRTLSRRGSWVQIPPPAPHTTPRCSGFVSEGHSRRIEYVTPSRSSLKWFA